MTNSELKVLLALLALAGIAVGVWYFRDDILPQTPVPVVVPPEPVVEQEPEPQPTEPLHPVEPVTSLESGEVEVLPPLDESDESFLNALIGALGNDVGSLLVNEAIIDRLVASIDNLPRKHVPEKIRPVSRLPSSFVAAGSADDRYFVLGPENFHRYDAIVDLISGLDLDAAVSVYQRYYPLFQDSYERLGYPDAYFNDRLVEVIDHMLATPEPQQTLQLVRPHVLFKFADPDLEDLSSGQKLLLRSGPDHAAQVKVFLRELRGRIVVVQATRL